LEVLALPTGAGEARRNTAGARWALAGNRKTAGRRCASWRRREREENLMVPLLIGYARVSTDEQDVTRAAGGAGRRLRSPGHIELAAAP
jgi:hypothetical protein